MSARLPDADQADVWQWAWRTVRVHRRRFTSMLVLFCTATVLGLVGPQVLGGLVDSVTGGSSARHVDVLAGVFLAVLVAQAVLTRAARVRATLLGEHLLASAREEFVGNSLRLPLGTVESAGTGDLLSRATTDIDRLDYTMRNAVPEMTTVVLTLALTMLAMIVTSPLLACGMLVAVPLVVLGSRWYFPRARNTLERMLARWADVQSTMHESVEGARTIESLRLADRRMARNETVIGRAESLERRHRHLLTIWLPSLELSYVLPIAGILLLGGWAYQAGLAGLGTITTVVLYAQAIGNPLDELMTWLEELQTGNAALRRVLGVTTQPAVPADTEPVTPGRSAAIDVRNVHFGYTPDREVLHGVNLPVPAGQRLVIVGPSGAGKSTLGRLIAGINAPDSGTITLGGTDLATLPTERLRREVVLLTQEQHVFACSLRENLTLPAAAEDDALFDVLDTVGVVEWARGLPHGLDTVLGAGGHPVPAALAQQLALARVLLADPPTLILDEATSLLDNATSRNLERSLSTVLAGRTVIAIAHRLHTARAADQVAVINGGEIVELGTHTELLRAGGSYARLHQQTSRSAEDS